MSTGIGTGSLLNLEGFFGRETQIDETAAQELAAAYFGIDASRRQRTLRIPLDRLDRSAGYRDLTDRAIDLGIALEAHLRSGTHVLEGFGAQEGSVSILESLDVKPSCGDLKVREIE
jgi:hypothetical protein